MPHKDIIVSHGNCPDGAASVVVAKRITPSIHYIRGYHDRIDEQILKAANDLKTKGSLWIVDISCNPETLDQICEIIQEKKGFLGIYEHHVSRDYLADYTLPTGLNGEILFDNDRCGSRIFYEHQYEKYSSKIKDLKDFIRLTNDRDLWLNEDPLSAELGTLHNIYGDEHYVNRFVKNSSIHFSEPEAVLLKFEKEKLLKRMHHLLSKIEIKEDNNGMRYGIMIGEGKASELCNAAIHKFNLEYVCLVDFNSKRVSIRSFKVFDCATFSQERGGGGHARAAGFPIKRGDFILHESSL